MSNVKNKLQNMQFMYLARIGQSDTNAPVVDVLHNNIGTQVTFSFNSDGNFLATLADDVGIIFIPNPLVFILNGLLTSPEGTTIQYTDYMEMSSFYTDHLNIGILTYRVTGDQLEYRNNILEQEYNFIQFFVIKNV